MWALIKILIACILSAALYRMGGKGKPYNTKYRDLGCPTVGLILIFLLFGFKLSFLWLYLLTFGLSFGALTLYWDDSKNKFLDKICRTINWKYPEDNFYLHGLMIGLAGIPLLWCGVPTPIVMLRIVICALGMGYFSKLIGNDVKEELVRGAIFII